MDVSIILVNFNTKVITNNCINSILEKTFGVSYEIILVDNNSTDGSIDFYKNDSRIRFIENGVNLGFGCANNIGVRYAQGKFLFFLNTDTILINNAVKIFYDTIQKHEEIGILGSLLYDKDFKLTTSYIKFSSIKGSILASINFCKRRCFKHPKKENIRKTFQIIKKVEVVSGADLFIKKELFDRVEGFDEDYFMYGEEVELEYRISKLGYEMAISSEPKIIHLEGSSSKDIGDRRLNFFTFYSMKRGQCLFYRKHKSLLYRLLSLLVDIPLDLVFISIDNRFKGKRLKYLKLYNLLFRCSKITPQKVNMDFYN